MRPSRLSKVDCTHKQPCYAGTKDPLKFCQILIQELELADECLTTELESLREIDGDDL